MALEAQNNPFPSILIAEHADPESIPDANPAAGYKRLVVKDDLTLWLLDDTGTATEVGGGSGFADPMTTRGDIIYRDASNVTARLARGSASQVLTSDGTDIAWATPSTPAAGAWTWIERKTFSASSSVDFQALSTGTYDTHCMIFNKVVMSGNNHLWVRVGTTGSFTIDTGNNYNDDQFVWRAGGSGGGGAATQSSWRLTYTGSTPLASSTVSWRGKFFFYDLGDTTAHKIIEGRLVYSDTGFRVSNEMRGTYTSATAVTALQVLPSAGTITSGTVDLYGIKHA